MGRINAIDLKQNFKDLAKDLAGRGKQELRAKTVNRQQVLYSRSVNRFSKLVDNLFFQRGKKRSDASAMLAARFATEPPDVQKSALKHVRETKPTAASAMSAFAMANSQAEGVRLSDLHNPEHAIYFAEFLKDMLQSGAAEKAGLGAEARNLLDLISVRHSSPEHARNVLARFMAEMVRNDEESTINVPPDKQLRIIAGLQLPGFQLSTAEAFQKIEGQSQLEAAMKAYDWNKVRQSKLTSEQMSNALAPAIADLARSFTSDNRMITAFKEWKVRSLGL